MTNLEIRQQKKNEALNKIRRIFNKRYRFPYDQYDESSGMEQKAFAIKSIIEDLENDLSSFGCKVSQAGI